MCNLKRYKQLLYTTENITRREIKIRYAGSFLGSLWSVIYPSAFAVTTAVIFSLVLRGYIGNIPYFLYVLIGFSSWFWFSQTVAHATRSLIYNRDLILNNKFPTETIIFSIAISKFVDYSINVVVWYAFLLIFHQQITIKSIILVLFISICQFVFQIGVSLAASAINIYIRDLQNIVDISLQLIFYGTPVIYSLNIIPREFRTWILMNPMTQVITAYRNALFQHYLPAHSIILLILIALITLITGYTIYKKLEPKFAELI